MDRPRVVVVGAGFAGAATALHLARGGARVTVLEREAMPGAHASSQNAGMLRTTIADPAVAVVAVAGARGVALAGTWSEAPLVRPCGSLLLARDAALAELQPAVPRLEAFGREVRWLEPPEAAARVPLVAGGRFTAALWAPEDGVVDTTAYLAALLRGARDAGAAIRLGTEVLAGDPGWSGGPARLETRQGAIEADAVVIAAGAWADDVAQRLHVQPAGIVPHRRHLHATGPLPEVDPAWPFVWSVGDEVYFRPESGGLLLSPCDEEPFPACEPPADPASRDLLARKVQRAFPRLLDLPLMRSWAGLRSFPADRRFVLGRDAAAGRVFWAAGLGGHGVTSAWELGRLAADAVLGRGEPPGEFAPWRSAAPSPRP